MLKFFRRYPLVVAGAAIVVVWIVVSAGAPLFAAYGPLAQRVVDRLQPPSPNHLFGTDALGRDILSRVLYGGRISLPVGFGVVAVSFIIGGAIGALAGFGSGWLDGVLMRSTDMVMAFPIIILAMTIAAALGPGLDHTMIALVAVSWLRYARVIRSLVLSVKENEYVQASRGLGASWFAQRHRRRAHAQAHRWQWCQIPRSRCRSAPRASSRRVAPTACQC